MKTGNLRNLLMPAILILLIATLSCGAGGRDVYEVSTLAVDSFTDLIFPDDKPVLKKKILVAPVVNKAGISDDEAEEIRQDCILNLAKDKYLLITKLKNWGDSESASILKNYGAIPNPAYAKTVEEMGMNAFFTLVLHPFEITEKRTGIWPYRKDSYNVLISMSINVLDPLNGTFTVYEDKTEYVNVEKTDSEKGGKWTPDFSAIKSEISSMTKVLCSSVIEKLRNQPWRSKVSIKNGNMVINAGTANGVSESTVFEIFKKGEFIDAYSDEGYYIFGDKLGESGVKSISENSAVLAANLDAKDAAFVRVKR